MKKYLWLTFIPVILFMTGLSQASYRIELESGKSVITRHYWEEDGWIMFYQYDGVVGYPARLVRDIRESDRPPPNEIVEEAVGGEQREDLDTTDVELIEEADEAETDMDPDEFEKKVKQYQEKLKSIQQEIVRQADIYYTAMNEGQQLDMEEAQKNHAQATRDREKLREIVLVLYNEQIPDWWYKIKNQESGQ